MITIFASVYEDNTYISFLEGKFPVISEFHLKMLKYPFFTITKLPKGIIKHFGEMQTKLLQFSLLSFNGNK